MTAYYNEIEPYAAQWLRNLIAAGHIAPGDVDERSIEDVHPDDLKPYTQCHFFAGVGVWSYALRAAGWPDDRPVWTGSCPCQPFSQAGQGAGFADERHLWPAFFHLIEQRRPATVFGEQVASKDAEPWLDALQADMEAVGYAIGAVPFPSASVGAPHIRDRLYWMAHASSSGCQKQWGQWDEPKRSTQAGLFDGLADTSCSRIRAEGSGASGSAASAAPAEIREQRLWPNAGAGGTVASGLANGSGQRRERREGVSQGCVDDRPDAGRLEGNDGPVGRHEVGIQRNDEPGPVNGFWADADWLLCRDGKWRPVEPGSFPLAHGATARVGRLRAYGNAICAKAAQTFIEAAMSCTP